MVGLAALSLASLGAEAFHNLVHSRFHLDQTTKIKFMLFFLSNISLAGVRRLLEEAIGLDKNTLDAIKNFGRAGAGSGKEVKKKVDVKQRKLRKVNNEEESDATQTESDEMNYKVKTRKVTAPRNVKNSEQLKKRKITENADIDVSPKKKPNKLAKSQKEEDNNLVEDESLSEDGQWQSSVERSALVENLKSIIKACGMSILPVIYKKAKQAIDDKRETIVVKELEVSNVETSDEDQSCSRRRSTFGFVALDKPLVRGKKDKVGGNGKDLNDDNKGEEKEAEDDEDESEEFDEALFSLSVEERERRIAPFLLFALNLTVSSSATLAARDVMWMRVVNSNVASFRHSRFLLHAPPRSSYVLWPITMRSREQMESGPYPVREGELDCSYYIRTGVCRFGPTCRFNHPPNRKLAIATAMMKGEYPERIGQPECEGQPSSALSSENQPPSAVNIQNDGASHQGDSGNIASEDGSVPMGYYAFQKDNVFPERPGQSECQFYMKTGDCKFGAVCKFHHPKERLIPVPDCHLSPIGLPLRPGEPVCVFYSRYGICKFGPSCKFDHPMRVFAYNTPASSSTDFAAIHRFLASSPGTVPANFSSDGLMDGSYTNNRRLSLSEARQKPSGDNNADSETLAMSPSFHVKLLGYWLVVRLFNICFLGHMFYGNGSWTGTCGLTYACLGSVVKQPRKQSKERDASFNSSRGANSRSLKMMKAARKKRTKRISNSANRTKLKTELTPRVNIDGAAAGDSIALLRRTPSKPIIPGPPVLFAISYQLLISMLGT
ncbi:hypothetical protein SASPL_136980 [Salvia splendens]|uniref:C3H1-type domain-containing protein n=1 Tax=Salvia splendens TaxID=180675 RepID=A0A8X8ZGZ3_SALSN|nr:hypothetical protein SASPL_136980 [Salvia splendens]